jgi:cyanophycin synthetase
VAQLVGHLLRVAGYKVGMATSTGLTIDRRVVEAGDCTRWDAAHRLLRNRLVEAAVIENGPAMIANEGLSYDRCLVGVVTDLDPAFTMPERYLESPEQIWKVARTQVDVVLPEGAAVLDAHDPQVVEMAELSDGPAILFATDSSLPAVTSHCRHGGKAVVLDGNAVYLVDGSRRDRLLDLGSTLVDGQWRGTVAPASLLASVAAAIGLGLPLERLRAGIQSFVPVLARMVAPAGRTAASDRAKLAPAATATAVTAAS